MRQTWKPPVLIMRKVLLVGSVWGLVAAGGIAHAKSAPSPCYPEPSQETELRADSSDWALIWDPADGIVRFGWQASSGSAKTYSGSFPPARVQVLAATRAMEFIAKHTALLGVAPHDLVLTGARPAGRLLYLHYQQRHAGIPVENARLTLAFTANAELVSFSSAITPRIAPATLAPALTLEQARGRVLATWPNREGIEWREGDLAILPRTISGLPLDRLVWRLRCRTINPHGSWRTLIDASTGEVLLHRSLVTSPTDPAEPTHADQPRPPLGHSAPGNQLLGDQRKTNLGAEVLSNERATELGGQVLGDVVLPDPWGEPATIPFPDLAVELLSDTFAVASTFTDSAGRFDFGDIVAENPVLRASLEGRYARVHSSSLTSEPASITVDDPESPVGIRWSSINASPAEREAYLHVNAAHDWIKEVDPASDSLLPQLDDPIPVVVDYSSVETQCDGRAFLDLESPWLRFTAEGDACVNLGRIANIVQHEYGHLVTLYAYWPDWAPEPIQEAFSDYFSATLADTSLVGFGWKGPGTWVRDLEEYLSWPVGPGCALSPHCLGQLLAGALWEIRAELIREIGDRDEAVLFADRLFHSMRYAKPQDFQSCLLNLLLQDDDDHDPTNGTPHLNIIANAFEDRGIGDFSVSLFHLPLTDSEDADAAREVIVALGGIYPPNPDRVYVHYSVNSGGFKAVPLTGEGYVYHGMIPAQASGSRVRYFITVDDTRGRTESLPQAAPSETFSYLTGPDETAPVIFHTRPDPPSTTATGIWFAARIGDNGDTVDSAWVAATIEDNSDTWEVHAPFLLKTRCDSLPPAPENLRTDLYEAHLPLERLTSSTRIGYRISATDGSTGANRADFPTESETDLNVHRGWDWDFETGIGDLQLDAGWSWAALDSQTTAASFPAPSGSAVASAAVNSVAEPGSPTSLTIPERDLANWEHARLAFWSWYRTVGEYAGGRVLASADDGETWQAVSPIGGYPGRIRHDADQDGTYESIVDAFTGDGEGWQRVTFALDDFAGGSMRLRLEAVDDAGSDGWFVDDLQLVEAPALAPPR